MNTQPIFNIAEIFAGLGVREAVLSPGSRNAPLIIAFARHPSITSYSIPDERTAAFVALGMARSTGRPVALACTSGSASLNYAPAVAEAFFQQIPLIVLTADRPPEWIGQLDGQTIRQDDLYGKHVKKSYALQADLSHADASWHVYQTAAEAFIEATSFPFGPVHINCPFREPFYPEKNDEMYFDSSLRFPQVQPSTSTLKESDWNNLHKEFRDFPRKLIMGGQSALDAPLSEAIDQFTVPRKIPVIGDIISNLHGLENIVKLGDLYAVDNKTDVYAHITPDLLITFGKSIISKNVKLLLRQNPPKTHWHIQEAGKVANTFKSLTRVIRCSPLEFFRKMGEFPIQDDFEAQKQENYRQLFSIEERKALRFTADFFEGKPLGEFEIVHAALQHLPENSILHLANSLAVRYANWCGMPEGRGDVEVIANRGTSGIDGCSSTAVGSALVTDRLNLLITGDVAFFYDRNAFWHNYPLNNLRILLLNNHGGGIFRMINGPGQLAELEEFFETKQRLTGKHVADEFGMEYMLCDKKAKVSHFLADFFQVQKSWKSKQAANPTKVSSGISKKACRVFDRTILSP